MAVALVALMSVQPGSERVNERSFSPDAPRATFVATLSNPSALPVLVRYDTSDGPAAGPSVLAATVGADYVAAGGTLTFAPGTTSRTTYRHLAPSLAFSRWTASGSFQR